MQNFCVIVINNLFKSTENTYLLFEYQCNLNKTTLTCNLTKLLAFITKKRRRRNTYSCKKLFIVPSGLFNNYFKVNSVTSKDPLFSNGLSRSVKPWQPLELQLGRKENHHLIQQCQNGSSEWVWWSQYRATNDKLNISYFSYGYCPSGLFFKDCLQGEAAYSCKFSLSSRPSLGAGGRLRGDISPRNTLYSGDFKSCFH